MRAITRARAIASEEEQARGRDDYDGGGNVGGSSDSCGMVEILEVRGVVMDFPSCDCLSSGGYIIIQHKNTFCRVKTASEQFYS